MARKRKKRNSRAQARQPAPWSKGRSILAQHTLFAELVKYMHISCDEEKVDKNGWAFVDSNGWVYVNPNQPGTPEEWAWVLGSLALHLGFGHFPVKESAREWLAACNCVVEAFIRQVQVGRSPSELGDFVPHPIKEVDKLFSHFLAQGIEPEWQERGVNGRAPALLNAAMPRWGTPVKWQRLLANGMSASIQQSLDRASGIFHTSDGPVAKTAAQKAKDWFMSSFPLLGALAASFRIVEKQQVCYAMDIAVAAVSAEDAEIYINPAAGLDEEELLFVIAHELMHVGLSHHARRQGRDPFLWNVACDFVINSWLIEMQIGSMPLIGGLYDPELKGLSAESIYDTIVGDLRRMRKLRTFRGVGGCDIIDGPVEGWWAIGKGMELDEFYRRCLAQGLEYHQSMGRGYLPAGLIQDIRALSHPPVPWDVELAQWFDSWLPPIEKRRSYARLSRRQQATPDIPRPSYVTHERLDRSRTFGVVLDTSGSMNVKLLGCALGAIASYAIARDVPAVRVVFCDAAAYDQGYMAPEDIAHRVRVKGRGGTVLQPGIDILERADDFPKDGPILLITDGMCDVLRIRREHAFLLPKGAGLPFAPKGPVFRMES